MPSRTTLARLIATSCLACAVVLSGCTRTQHIPLRALPTGNVVEALRGGATLALPRPTPEVAWLSLWLATGSRDASPPQLATAAAWLVAERANAQARVEPDATEISFQCDVAGTGLKTCVERVGQALTRRDVAEHEALRLRERLRTTRLRAAADYGRMADERALGALLGAHAPGFFPLGEGAQDTQVTATALSRFLGQHMRVEHSLLIAAGDVRDGPLDQAFARFRPRGQAAPQALRKMPTLRSQVTVDEDERGSLSIALAVPDTRHAAAIAQDFDALYPGAQARVARLSGFALLHVRVPAGPEPLTRLQRAVFDLRRLSIEAAPERAPPRSDGLQALTRELGEVWVSRSIEQSTLPTPWPMGVAVTLRASAAPPDDKDAGARKKRLEEAARVAVTTGELNATGPLDGEADALRADLTVPNGVRIAIERRPGDRFLGAALRIVHGSGDDPDRQHGRAALLATWLSDGCGFAQGRKLDVRLATISARMTPLVDVDSSGLSIVAPKESWQAALDALLRCAVRPATHERAIEDARARLLATLRSRTDVMYESFAARALASSTPGFIASWGTPLGVSAVSAQELRRLHREVMQGANLTVSIAVDADPGEVARFVSRRVAQLERGQEPAPASPAAASPTLLGEQLDVPALRVVVGLRAEGDARGKLAPSVVASALSAALAQHAGESVWHQGKGHRALSFAAVALATTEERLSTLEGVVSNVLSQLQKRSDASWLGALRQAELTRNAQRSEVASAVTEGVTYTTRRTANEELATVKALLATTPHFAVLRPRSQGVFGVPNRR